MWSSTSVRPGPSGSPADPVHRHAAERTCGGPGKRELGASERGTGGDLEVAVHLTAGWRYAHNRWVFASTSTLTLRVNAPARGVESSDQNAFASDGTRAGHEAPETATTAGSEVSSATPRTVIVAGAPGAGFAGLSERRHLRDASPGRRFRAAVSATDHNDRDERESTKRRPQ